MGPSAPARYSASPGPQQRQLRQQQHPRWRERASERALLGRRSRPLGSEQRQTLANGLSETSTRFSRAAAAAARAENGKVGGRESGRGTAEKSLQTSDRAAY